MTDDFKVKIKLGGGFLNYENPPYRPVEIELEQNGCSVKKLKKRLMNCIGANRGMKELIKALEIFDKYGAEGTICDHDVLYVPITQDEMSSDDIDRLNELGFIYNSDDCFWLSHKWGSM